MAYLACCFATAKEIALSFDDPPVHTTHHFESAKRTVELKKKLKSLSVSGAMTFANPCKNEANVVSQLMKYVVSGTCTHPRLEEVGFEVYSKDTKKAS